MRIGKVWWTKTFRNRSKMKVKNNLIKIYNLFYCLSSGQDSIVLLDSQREIFLPNKYNFLKLVEFDQFIFLHSSNNLSIFVDSP